VNSERAILFVHGAGADSRHFSAQLNAHGYGRTALAIDLPSHGRSKYEGIPDIDCYRDAALALVDALSLSDIVAVGHSMGGGILFEMLKAIPDKLSGFVFMCTAPVLPVNDMIFEFIDKDFDSFCAIAAKLLYTPGIDQSFISFAIDEFKRVGPAVVRNDFMICKKFNYTGLAEEMRHPCLCIATEVDKMVPEKLVREFASLVPQSRMVTYETGGHMPYLEIADRVNDDLAAFIGSISK
jgi:pimeloyl-ACP methyl ester carboxylesterase